MVCIGIGVCNRIFTYPHVVDSDGLSFELVSLSVPILFFGNTVTMSVPNHFLVSPNYLSLGIRETWIERTRVDSSSSRVKDWP